eukprot:g988.t1
MTLTFLAALACCTAANEVFVSPAGSDTSGFGTAAAPYATLGRAQLAVRAVIAQGPLAANVTVHVAAGTYHQSTPLRFTAADSGNNGFRVRWVGPGPAAGFDPSRAAVVHGGVPVEGGAWSRVPGNDGVWAANFSDLRPPTPPAPPTPAPTPAGGVPAVANSTLPHCGSALVGTSFDGNDLPGGELLTGSIDACCRACANFSGCNAWSYCNLPPDGEVCGSHSNPIDCYLKSGAPARPSAMATRVSGVPGAGCRPTYPPGPAPAPAAPWRFFNLLEARVGAVQARVPKAGGGYLKDVACTNSNTQMVCPRGVLPAAGLTTPADASVFVNIGANWFTETRAATSSAVGADGSVTVEFRGGSGNANDKIYLQGSKELISEPGEWALDSAAGMLYYWPRDQAAMAAGRAEVVALTTKRVLDIRGNGWAPGELAQAIDFDGIVFSGSDFTHEYGLGNMKKRTNDTPQPLREGMVRIENATDVRVERSALLDAGYSAFWLQGFAQNVSIVGNWIERPGFCGAYFQGIYPGDTTADSTGVVPGGPIDSAAASDVNKGHAVESNLIFDYGRRVGHGSGLWWFQAGSTRAAHNHVQEGPRDAFGVYGVRYGNGGGNGVLPRSAYNATLDFWRALDLLHTRHIQIDHNVVANAVRDTADAGALEYWGTGAWNTAHHNCFSDMDPGVPNGSWMNYLFQDDAAHYLNFSSNVVHDVHGAGSQEGGMIKSVGSVFENNVVADSNLGHAFNLQPYLEPAANMVFARNVFANLTGSGGVALDLSTNDNTFATMAKSAKLAPFANYDFEAGPPAGWPALALTDPVLAELDYNVYFGVQGFDPSALQQRGFDLHASTADPRLPRSAASLAAPWARTCSDYALAALPVPGFRPLDLSGVGLDARFEWDRAALNRRDAAVKIEAERYQRMHGLWRQGSFCISEPEKDVYDFASDAWARYDNVNIACDAPCTFTVRFKSASGDKTPRNVALALDAPLAANVVATVANAQADGWALLNGTTAGPIHRAGATLFLLLDGVCNVDFFYLR